MAPDLSFLKDASVLIAGNSPAVESLKAVPVREDLVVLGINRLQHVAPSCYLVVDDTVEDEWIPREGSVRAFFTIPGCRHRKSRTVGRDREDLVLFDLGVAKPRGDAWRWIPNLQTSVVACRNTAAYGLNLLVALGVREVAFIGVDYNAQQLHRAGEKVTHSYGRNNHAPPLGLHDMDRDFWTFARESLPTLGIRAVNLSPYDDAPFTQIGWERARAEDYVRRGPSGVR